jgi:hypothetical protein
MLYGFFKLFNIASTDPHIILYFQVFNLVIGRVMVWLWHRIAELLRLSLNAEWVGYLALTMHFAFLKYDY